MDLCAKSVFRSTSAMPVAVLTSCAFAMSVPAITDRVPTGRPCAGEVDESLERTVNRQRGRHSSRA